MLRVTFYSYKGGVGRTLALLNVAALLAQHGRKVVAVDLDLEAPGFGLSALTSSPDGTAERGVSELLLEHRDGENMDHGAKVYAYPILRESCGDNLWLMPSGRRGKELSDAIPEIYADLSGPSAKLFDLLVAEIQDALSPDYLLFDSRTGLADIAGVCTLALPEVLVAVCGLSEQNVTGMAGALAQMKAFRDEGGMPPVATMLVLSPIPRAADLGVPTLHEVVREREGRGAVLAVEREGNILFDAVDGAQRRLLPILLEELRDRVQKHFPDLDRRDLLHGFEYDPEVPLRGELHVFRACALAAQYRGLARSLQRAARDQEPLPGDDEPLLPILVGYAAG